MWAALIVITFANDNIQVRKQPRSESCLRELWWWESEVASDLEFRGFHQIPGCSGLFAPRERFYDFTLELVENRALELLLFFSKSLVNLWKQETGSQIFFFFPKDGSLLGILNSKLFQKMCNQLYRNVTALHSRRPSEK